MALHGHERGGLTGIPKDEREKDLHLELFLAIVIQIIPLLLFFFVGNLYLLGRPAVLRRVNVLSLIVTLKRQKKKKR